MFHSFNYSSISDKATFLDGGKVIETGTFRHVMRKYCETMGKRDKCLAGRKANA